MLHIPYASIHTLTCKRHTRTQITHLIVRNLYRNKCTLPSLIYIELVTQLLCLQHPNSHENCVPITHTHVHMCTYMYTCTCIYMYTQTHNKVSHEEVTSITVLTFPANMMSVALLMPSTRLSRHPYRLSNLLCGSVNTSSKIGNPRPFHCFERKSTTMFVQFKPSLIKGCTLTITSLITMQHL